MRRRDFEQDLAAELDCHLEMHIADNLRAGMTPEEARRQALIKLGGVEQTKELYRERRSFQFLDTLWQDIRYTLRTLRRAPGFTLVAVGSLALGIGANTAIFTLINVAMLKRLPVRHPEELAVISADIPGQKNANTLPAALWEQVRAHKDVFAGIFAYSSTGVDLSNGGARRQAAVGLVSGGFFSTLGVKPAAGRLFADADDYRGCPGIAVLTHGFWRSEYGGRDVIGKTIEIQNHPLEIVGVAEPEFFGVEYGYYAPIWSPQCVGRILRGNGYAAGGLVVGRLLPGTTIAQARARIQALSPALVEAASPESAPALRKVTLGVDAFDKGIPDLADNAGKALQLLMAVVGLVLLIACANIANLLLARASVRQREIGVRLALGAGRGRIVRQLLTESMLLSSAGAVLGFTLALWLSRAMAALLSGRRRIVLDLTPDATVLGFTLAASFATGVLFGLLPAWRAARFDPQAAIKPGGRGIAAGHSRFGAGKALVAAQLALSLVTLAGAGLLLSSWRRLASIDPGFRSQGVITANVNTRPARIPSARLPGVYRETLSRLRGLPGVTSASASMLTPFGNFSASINIAAGENTGGVRLNEVSPGYFATLGIPILAGRDVCDTDAPGSPRVAIVSRRLVQRFFGDIPPEAAVGKTVTGRDGYGEIEIAGVVADTKEDSLREVNRSVLYLALSQNPDPDNWMYYSLRTGRPAAALLPAIKAAITEINPRFSYDLETLEAHVDNSMELQRTMAVLAASFSAPALPLAVVTFKEGGGRRASFAALDLLGGGEVGLVGPGRQIFGDVHHDLVFAALQFANPLGVDEHVDVVLRGARLLLLGDQPVMLAHRGGGHAGGSQRRARRRRGRWRGARRLLDLIRRAVEVHVALLVDADQAALLERLAPQAVDVDAIEEHGRDQQRQRTHGHH